MIANMRNCIMSLRTSSASHAVALLWAMIFLLTGFSFLPAAVPSEDRVKITFEDRLAFYLNQKSKGFLLDMANKEQLLLGMIKNITSELRLRGERAVLQDELGYGDVFGYQEQLIAEYSEELDQILDLIDEIRRLERVVEQVRDVESWDELVGLRYELIGLLEDRDLYKKGVYSLERVSGLFKEYYREIDSVLWLSHRLDKLERFARQQGDEVMLTEIEAQRREIRRLLGTMEEPGEDTLSEEYLQEAEMLVQILKRLDELEGEAVLEGADVTLDIEELRRSILERVDQRLLTLLGYEFDATVDGPRVSELFQEWKAEQIADYKVRFTQYKIMKTRLLGSGSPAERARMLDRDLKAAFSSYVDENYALAELRFNQILKDYVSYFSNFDAVVFYRGESYYGRQLYEPAVNDYETVVHEYPNSFYFGDALARLLLIHERSGNLAAFHRYFDLVEANAATLERNCREQCNYLAGYVYLRTGEHESARNVLELIPKGSKYYMTAQYLLGIVHANAGEYTSAIKIFEDLANRENYPWTDPQTTFLRNNALLKLGYVHYELGEYEKALSYFESVSPGFQGYDRGLLGAAWSNLKRGEYETAIQKVRKLFNDYLASNYTYEALVLSAHCKRILNRRDEALRDLRYVANARGVLDLSRRYNAERKEILDQLSELDRIEQEILDRRDRNLYQVTAQIRDQIQDLLLEFRHHSATGTLLLDELQQERQGVFRQIEELNHLIDEAQATGQKAVVDAAYHQRARLIKTLETYQADASIRNVNYFVDYPLATKESVATYRKEVLSDLLREMEDERQRIARKLAEARQLQRTKANGTVTSATLDLEILQEDLEKLRDRSSRLKAWIEDNSVEEINTRFDQWADFSGFGMSDITFANIEEREEDISELAYNVSAINHVLEERKRALEKRLERFDAEVRRIQEELQQEQIQMEKKEKEKYFQELYFEVQDREIEPAPGDTDVQLDSRNPK